MPSKSGLSLSRDWSKSEHLGSTNLSVSDKLSLRSSGGGNSSARYVNSVTDLYANDEIDALLDEIRVLEPALSTAQTADDLRAYTNMDDDTIHNGNGRLPVPRHLDIGLPTTDSRHSVHSWDSHGIYRKNEVEDLRRHGGPISMYFDYNHLRTPIGILRVVLLFASVLSFCCLIYSGTGKYGIFSLPHVGRIRFMIFTLLFNSLVTILLLFLDISLLHRAFPIQYRKWVILVYLILCSGYCAASSLLIGLVSNYSRRYRWVLRATRELLIASSVFGFMAGLSALLMAVFATYELCRVHLHLPLGTMDDQVLTLSERASSGESSEQEINCNSKSKRPQTLNTTHHNNGASAHYYRHHDHESHNFHSHQPSHTQVMEPPVTSKIWPVEDVQPCSSKHSNCNLHHSHHHHHNKAPMCCNN